MATIPQAGKKAAITKVKNKAGAPMQPAKGAVQGSMKGNPGKRSMGKKGY